MALYNKKKVLQHLNMNIQKEIDKQLEKEKFDLQNTTYSYNSLKNNKSDEANKRMKPLPENIENIEKIKTSHDYSGAIGELHVIKNLETLSNEYYLLNDVSLELDHYIRFGNSHLKSAQIDHLVLGPTGVYVIETKNWSAEFVQQKFSEGNFTPYDQIRRGNYLLYKYLNGSTKIKSIIAIQGARIPQSEEYTRVMRTSELSQHIRKGYKVLSTEDINEIAGLLIPLVNN